MDLNSLSQLVFGIFRGEALIETDRANVTDIMKGSLLCFTHEHQLCRLKCNHLNRSFIQLFCLTLINIFLIALFNLPSERFRFILLLMDLLLYILIVIFLGSLNRIIFKVIICEFDNKKEANKQYMPLKVNYIATAISFVLIQIYIFGNSIGSITIENMIDQLPPLLILIMPIGLTLEIYYTVKETQLFKIAEKMKLCFPLTGADRINLSNDFKITLKSGEIEIIDLNTRFVHILKDQTLHIGIRKPKPGETFQYQTYSPKDIDYISIKSSILRCYRFCGWIVVPET